MRTEFSNFDNLVQNPREIQPTGKTEVVTNEKEKREDFGDSKKEKKKKEGAIKERVDTVEISEESMEKFQNSKE